MKKLPLIGISIIAVVLLVLVSLNNVIGYQSLKSSAMPGSPLFIFRTQKAINQQQNGMIYHYLGEGKEPYLNIPSPDNRTDLLKRAMEYIKAMDDKAFNNFMDLLLSYLQRKEKITDMNAERIAYELRQLRDGPISIGYYDISSTQNMTWRDTPTLCWFPGCILFQIFTFIFICLLFILITIMTGETFCVGTCISHCNEIIDMKKVRFLIDKI
jgi:hypothetical protein